MFYGSKLLLEKKLSIGKAFFMQRKPKTYESQKGRSLRSPLIFFYFMM